MLQPIHCKDFWNQKTALTNIYIWQADWLWHQNSPTYSAQKLTAGTWITTFDTLEKGENIYIDHQLL